MNYEEQQRQAILRWQQQAPGRVSAWVSGSTAPLAHLVDRVIPPSAIQAALEAACALAERLASPGKLLAETGLAHVSDLKAIDLEQCDRLADQVHDRAIVMAAAEGGVTGAAVLAGIALDVPGLMTLSLRTIYQTGLCYGFELKGEEGRQLALRIFSLASANSLKEKEAALLSLVALRQMLLHQSWGQIQQAAATALGKEAAVLALRDAARQLGVNLTQRKALNLVPVIGAAVGASINAGFVKDVGWAARRVFQEMWLAGRESSGVTHPLAVVERHCSSAASGI